MTLAQFRHLPRHREASLAASVTSVRVRGLRYLKYAGEVRRKRGCVTLEPGHVSQTRANLHQSGAIVFRVILVLAI